jgi:hypothetical protein
VIRTPTNLDAGKLIWFSAFCRLPHLLHFNLSISRRVARPYVSIWSSAAEKDPKLFDDELRTTSPNLIRVCALKDTIIVIESLIATYAIYGLSEPSRKCARPA